MNALRYGHIYCAVFYCVIFLVPTVFAANCYGGQLVSSSVIGSTDQDSYLDVASKNDELIAVGFTNSYTFPYNTSYVPYPPYIYPQEVIISIGGIQGDTIITGSSDNDQGRSVYVDSKYLCVSGVTSYSSTWPVWYYDYGWSQYGTYEDPFFIVFDRTTNYTRTLSIVYGTYNNTYTSEVACNSNYNVLALASDDGYDNIQSFDYDVKLNLFNLTNGQPLSEQVLGEPGYDDQPVAVDFYERGAELFWLIAGNTRSSGNNGFPVYNAYQNASNGNWDYFVWVQKINDFTPVFKFATFYGGAYDDLLYDATFDESGNIYLVGASGIIPLKNAVDATFCGYIGEGTAPCVSLTVFSFEGELLMSTYLGLNNSYPYSVTVQRLPDNGHLVFIAGSTDYTNNFPSIEPFNRNINATSNTQDGFIMVVYLAADFSSGEIRLRTLVGSSDADETRGITLLSNNTFAIVGTTYGDDLPGAGNYTQANGEAYISYFQCGSALYKVNPSPSPAASQPPPSPPPVTCQAQDGCYSVTGTVVQFQPGDDGQYTPSQTLFPGSEGSVQKDYYLNVEYLTLEEYDGSDNLIVSIPFPTSGYSLTSVDTVINGVNVTVVTFSTIMANGASVDVINYFYSQNGTLDFAGNVVAVEEGTTKVSVRISDWSFVDVSNTLTLTILLDISPAPKGPASSNTTGNQTTFSWDTGKTDCVVTTLDAIEIDDGIGTATLSVSTSMLKASFPHFTNYVLYDPGFQVLVKDDQSSSSPKEPISPWAYVGAALGAVVVVSVIVAIGYVLVSRQRRRTEKALSFKNETEMN